MKVAAIMIMKTRKASTPPHKPIDQKGMVLIVALVMLVIIGLASVGIMRSVMSNDLVAENTRRHDQAMHAAQAALRYCEELVLNFAMTPKPAAPNESTEGWKAFSTWKRSDDAPLSEGGPVYVSADFLNSAGEQSARYAANKAPRPQCMSQYRTLDDGKQAIIVTARGFSDNFEATQSGDTKAGAVVWLQSIIQTQSSS